MRASSVIGTTMAAGASEVEDNAHCADRASLPSYLVIAVFWTCKVREERIDARSSGLQTLAWEHLCDSCNLQVSFATA